MNSLKQQIVKQNGIMCLVFGIVLVLIAGCQPMGLETGAMSDSDTNDSEGGSVTTIATEEPQSEMEEGAVEAASMISLSSAQQAIATNAATSLAEELGIEASQVSITAMDSVEWPDASLGCPEEGMMYASVLTSGYRIMLEVDGESYEYHSDDRENAKVVKCEQKTE